VTARDLGNLKPGLSPGQYRRADRAHGGLAAPVILIGANLLLYAYHLYAYHPRAEQHEESRGWLEVVLSGPDLVRFAWLTLWAFLRIATNPRVFERPLSTSEAEAAISSWLAQPAAGILDPCERLGTSCAGLCATDRLPARS
jgi:predicted nucleic acid-binding protein